MMQDNNLFIIYHEIQELLLVGVVIIGLCLINFGSVFLFWTFFMATLALMMTMMKMKPIRPTLVSTDTTSGHD